MNDDSNGYLRLLAFARRGMTHGDPDARWFGDCVARAFETGCLLDDTLGLRRPGWASPRQQLMRARRDELLRLIYPTGYQGVGLRSAALVIAADHAHLLRRLGRMRPGLGGVDRAPRTVGGLHMLFIAEGFGMPGPARLADILRIAVIRVVRDQVSNLPPVEIPHSRRILGGCRRLTQNTIPIACMSSAITPRVCAPA